MFHPILGTRGRVKVNNALYIIGSAKKFFFFLIAKRRDVRKLRDTNVEDQRPTYCAQVNALSRASKLPPMKGAGGLGSKAIHQPTGILTVLIPCLWRKSKSSTVIKLFLCFCNTHKPWTIRNSRSIKRKRNKRNVHQTNLYYFKNFFCLIMAISISKLVIPMIIIRRNCHLKCGSIIVPTWCPWIVCCELVVFRGLKNRVIFLSHYSFLKL